MNTSANDVIHQAVRLKIMSALSALHRNDELDFTKLKSITGATDGNLGAHINTLENAGYVKVTKEFVGKKPRTSVTITAAGRKAFESHVAFLRDILDGASNEKGA
jgi:DNA-binding MarR family transcriptional regulator